jgi:YHS domain-containing protein
MKIKKDVNEVNNDKVDLNSINRGKTIYFKNEHHYIVYEFDDNIIISKNADLSKSYCVKKSRVSYNLKKNE